MPSKRGLGKNGLDIVSVLASLDGRLDMAVGNAIGSVTANTGLIMALSIIFMPSRVERRMYAPKSFMLLCAVVSLWLLCAKGTLYAKSAVVLFVILGLYITENIQSGKRKMIKTTGYISKRGLVWQMLYFVIGAAAVVMGSRLLVDNGCIIARLLKVPENVIAITMVAIGTSLPELVTAVTAISKKEASLTAGNIIGANIIDTALILPVCALLRGGSFAISPHTILLDIPACLAVVLIGILPMIITGKFKRIQGFALMAVYLIYIYIACFISPLN